MKIRISDDCCEWEYVLSEESDSYSIDDIMQSALRRTKNRSKIKIISKRFLYPNDNTEARQGKE